MTIITGRIVGGFKEGAYFLSMEHYKNEIKEKLHFVPFPGTLNIHSHDFDKKILTHPVRIEGFEEDGKKFGGATCYRAKIKDIKGALIFPDINKHENQIEFIADVKLRDKLGLKDHDEVEVHLV